MGALTLKSFPFELRGWDIEKLESVDPTDGFGSNTKVYINKNKIIQIEPDFDGNNSNSWLTDKGRQFFDGIFNLREEKKSVNESSFGREAHVFTHLMKVLYLFNHCRTQQSSNKFFTIVFENLSLEILSLLSLISQKYSFIKIRRAEKFNLNNNFESNSQLNLSSHKAKLQDSTLCLLIYNSPRYEGYYLNLNLRQRFLKGNFKCLVLGSTTDLTFPTFFLGSNVKTLKATTEGNNLVCQEIKNSSKPIFIFNTEFSKRCDGEKIMENFHILQSRNVFNNVWNNVSILNPSLNETGIQSVDKFLPMTKKDLSDCSSFYFINVSMNNMQNLKKTVRLKLFNHSFWNNPNKLKPILLSHDSKKSLNTWNIFSRDIKNYYHIPCSMFYENSGIFLNTEGFVKRSIKIIFKKKARSSWQVFRKVLKLFNNNTINLQNKDFLIFNLKNISNFKTYVFFHKQATKSLTNINFYLSSKNKSFVLINETLSFKVSKIKLNVTKQKYWLDNFYNGGKDEYSHRSLILSNCSKILKAKTTNFF